MIIDRPTPATQNGLENVIRGWPKWMFCKAFKKHKFCSSWRVQKAYWVGIAKSFADFCTCFSLVITPHNMPVSILFVCTATHVPWRRVQKAYWVGIAKSFADFCTCFSLVITTGVRQSSMLGFYGERVCRRRNQPCSLWEAQQAQLLSYQCIRNLKYKNWYFGLPPRRFSLARPAVQTYGIHFI